MLQWMKDRWTRRKARRMMLALSDQELHDLALSRSDIAQFLNQPADTPERMARMARIFGMDSKTLREDATSYREMAQVCGHCESRKTCAEKIWQDGITRQDIDFCPNARAYAYLTEKHVH